MKSYPKTSALIPCYNASKYLAQTLDSLMAQTVPFSEILLFDDKSTDDSVLIAHKYNIKVISSEKRTPQGPSYARNELLKVAAGDWIHFHDADDLLNPAFLEKLTEVTTENNDVIICNSDWQDPVCNSIQVKKRYFQKDLCDNPLESTISNPISVLGVLVKKESICGVGGFNETVRCWEDGDLFVRLAEAGSRFKVVDEVLAYAVRHGSGVSSHKANCASARFNFLKEYIQKNKALSKGIVQFEFEKVAAEYIRLNEYKKCKEVINFVNINGMRLPHTESLILIFLSQIFPKYLTFILQHKIHELVSFCNRCLPK